ncbi:7303_t:CDS:1 [Diversispora eburnea]|uniref:7303_t:CDS:1 n=1 Tax=Diversispora eburnea TaxID=1213867 RepID=A0A9N9EXM0_9GLOM|nr:7303_t:CDS:1 [Diversispora eburnea]
MSSPTGEPSNPSSEGTEGTSGGDEGDSQASQFSVAVDVLDTAKEKVEDKLSEIDKDSPEEISQNTAKITQSINMLDIIITIGLYYTSLFMDWLTILGNSTTISGFFFDLFLGSFLIQDWNFGQLDTVGRISGMTTSIQIGMFVITLIIFVFSKIVKKELPSFIGGPLYYGGPFQILQLFRTDVSSYHESMYSLDAQASQYIGILSQILIVIAAAFAAPDTTSSYNDNITNNNNTITVSNSTEEVTIQIKDTVIFVMTTHFISVVAIIMSSLLNIVQWLADIWRMNSDQIIIYYIFKYIMNVLTCYPCRRKKNTVGIDTGEIESKLLTMSTKSSEKQEVQNVLPERMSSSRRMGKKSSPRLKKSRENILKSSEEGDDSKGQQS